MSRAERICRWRDWYVRGFKDAILERPFELPEQSYCVAYRKGHSWGVTALTKATVGGLMLAEAAEMKFGDNNRQEGDSNE